MKETINTRISHSINFTEDKPEMPNDDTTKGTESISVSDEIESGHYGGQVHCGESDTEKEADRRVSILLGPQVNDGHAHILPHSSHFKVQIDALK